MSLRPEPRAKLVCSKCKLDWLPHEEIARKRASWHAFLPSGPTPGEIADKLDTDVCVELLLNMNRGPEGPAGPCGPQGATGPSGRC